MERTAKRQRDQAAKREQHLQSSYGLTGRDVEKIIRMQLGRCPVCGKPLGKQYHVEHAHDGSNEVRGVVHPRCNVLLGLAGDDPERLELAALYLRSRPLRYVPWPRGTIKE